MLAACMLPFFSFSFLNDVFMFLPRIAAVSEDSHDVLEGDSASRIPALHRRTPPAHFHGSLDHHRYDLPRRDSIFAAKRPFFDVAMIKMGLLRDKLPIWTYFGACLSTFSFSFFFFLDKLHSIHSSLSVLAAELVPHLFPKLKTESHSQGFEKKRKKKRQQDVTGLDDVNILSNSDR